MRRWKRFYKGEISKAMDESLPTLNNNELGISYAEEE